MPLKKRSPLLLPGAAVVLRRAKHACVALSAACVAIGFLASADAIGEQLLRPTGLTDAVVQNLFVLSGEADGADAAHLTGEQILPDDVTAEAVADDIQTVNEDFSVRPHLIGNGCTWRASLRILPPANAGIYELRLTVRTPQGPTALTPQRVDLYATEAERRAASLSVSRRIFATDPLDAALVSLILATLFGAAAFGLRRAYAKMLVEHGCLRVYQTKSAGDDTLLYCFDSQRAITTSKSYPVFSAAGQLLGIADVLEQQPCRVVLRLCAARAKAGCIVGLTPA